MSRDDLEDHIEDQLRNPDAEPTEQSPGEESETVEVALCKLVCTECGAVNGREPRPTDCPGIGQECPECDDLVVHDVVPDSDSTEVETE